MGAGKAAHHAQPPRLSSGFTLIELAVVIGVIALIIGALLPLLTAQTANTRINATRTRQDAIRTALTTFIAQHGYLPCPADGWILPGDAHYGREARSTVTALPAGTCDLLLATTHTPPSSVAYATTSAAVPAVTVFRGVLPWLDLGLPEDSANDAWNQRISYVVSDLGVTGFATRDAISGMLGGLTICSGLGASGTQIAPIPLPGAPTPNAACTNASTAVPTVSASSAAVALISHGENGYGAFIPPQGPTAPTGGAIRPYTQASTAEHANIDLTSNVLVQAGYSRDFDDLVMWLSPADLTAPLIKSGALPSLQSLVSSKFQQAKAQIISSMVLQRSTVQDPSTCAYGYQYLLSRPLPLASGNPSCTPGQDAFCLRSLTVPALSAQALPAGVNSASALTWSYTYDGLNPVNGPGSNRTASLASASSFDPWGNPLLFTTLNPAGSSAVLFTASQPSAATNPPYAFMIYSVGPDGLAGTADDSSMGVTINEVRSTLFNMGALLAPATSTGPTGCPPP